MIRQRLMKCGLFAAALLAMSLGEVNAALVVNGDFSGTEFTDNNSNNLNISMVDTGWQAKDFWTINGSQQMVHDTGDNWSVGQLNSVTTESGSQLTFSFDWTPGPNGTEQSLDIDYQLVGWRDTSASGTDEAFRGMNFGGAGVNVLGGGTAVDLIDGDTTTFVGNTNFSKVTVTSAASTTNNYSITYDLSGYGANFDDVSDYQYIGFRFNMPANDDPNNVGATIDNVSLSATAVPEPSSLALLGLCSVGLFLRRKRS